MLNVSSAGPQMAPRPPLRPGMPLVRVPFFIREIYKNGFLRKLAPGERRTGPIAKLLRSDRYWVVFSVHDESRPVLELWAEPGDVAQGRPPTHVLGLQHCSHVGPASMLGEHEFSFVLSFVNAKQLRFVAHSRDAMNEWVDCIRAKLGDMGVINPRGNLYSRMPNLTTNSIANTNIAINTSALNTSALNSSAISTSNSSNAGSNQITSGANNNTLGMNNSSAISTSAGATSTTATSPSAGTSRDPLSDPLPTPPESESGLASAEEETVFTTSISVNQTPPQTPMARQKSEATLVTSTSAVYLNDERHVTVINIEDKNNNRPADNPVRIRSSSQHQRSSLVPQSRREQLTNNRRREPRSSSLGPLIATDTEIQGSRNRTNSLESIESNPRQRHSMNNSNNARQVVHNESRLGLLGIPPHVPLPGLTCQLSSLPRGAAATLVSNLDSDSVQHQRVIREQHVLRLKKEMSHPSGVRLVLRKRDCHGSLALVDFNNAVWVAGWKQREFPILLNAFHVGDQIVSVNGAMLRTASDFHRMAKLKTGSEHIELIVRRLPFGTVLHLKRNDETHLDNFGLVLGPNNEIVELAGNQGASGKMVLSEINARPVGLFAKESRELMNKADANEDVVILVQSADHINKLRKGLKAIKGYKEYLVN